MVMDTVDAKGKIPDEIEEEHRKKNFIQTIRGKSHRSWTISNISKQTQMVMATVDADGKIPDEIKEAQRRFEDNQVIPMKIKK